MQIKEQMDASTILFKGDNYCNAYDLSYLNKNFSILSSELQNATDIYYKPRQDRSSWFDYKKALLSEANQGLSYAQRIILGSKSNLLSETLDELPETTFIDYAGYIYKIGARDGLTTSSSESTLQKYHDDYKVSVKYYSEKRAYGLVIEFSTNIKNALITINGLFEPITYLSNSAVVYYNGYNDFNIPKNADGSFDISDISVKVFKWDNTYIDIDNPIHPIKRTGKWFQFEEEIDNTYIIIFNKVFYNFEINQYNNHYIELTDTDKDDFSVFNLEDCYAYQVKNTQGEGLKHAKVFGFLNKAEDIVFFPTEVDNSMILYNGLYHDMTILPKNKSIKFNIPNQLYLTSDYSFIIANNFYSGDVENTKCFCDHTSEFTSTVSDILLEYRNKLDLFRTKINELQKLNNMIYNDFEDKLIFNSDKPNTFRLRYYPEEISLALYINGVRYDNELYFYYDIDTKNIEWKFTKANGGFDLDENSEIIAVYDFSYEINGLPKPYKNTDFNKVYLQTVNPKDMLLKYIPNENTVSVFVNGVLRNDKVDFTIDYDKKLIIWNNSDIDVNNDSVEALYELNYEVNGLDNEKVTEDKYRYAEEIDIGINHDYQLTLIPSDEEFMLFINGRKYIYNEDYTYNKNTNSIIWKNNSEDINDEDNIIIFYNFIYSDNDIINNFAMRSINLPIQVDTFTYNSNMNNMLVLSKVPEKPSISVFLNGIRYDSNLNSVFKWYQSSNAIKWVSKDITLEDGDSIAIIYSYTYQKNHMQNPNPDVVTYPTITDIVGSKITN
jgi:hypothetical protein